MATSFDFDSADGTAIRGWRSDGEGLPLVISNGLGTIPQAWPALVKPDSGYRAVSWYYRGTFGSERPRDPGRIQVEDHVQDMVALMDAEGIDRALVACWSIGVNIGFEFAQRHPDRVAGLMAVAGVPGGTFSTMGAPWRIPKRMRRPIATRAAKVLRAAGPVLTPVAHAVPVNDKLSWLVAHSGFMTPAAKPEVLTPMLGEFLRQDWKWYMGLAVAAGEHRPMDLSFVTCPTTLVAGKKDVLTSMQDVVETAAKIPHAQITVLPGSHFLPMEYPDLISTALGELARRSDL
ncbi:MAG: Alpha/beta hydrolase fold precursor [Frankiales bacterium]|nr:Alpha/beta hydrolase fold precursor [Frankiales bacterium]